MSRRTPNFDKIPGMVNRIHVPHQEKQETGIGRPVRTLNPTSGWEDLRYD